jgi:hypothetical protein
MKSKFPLFEDDEHAFYESFRKDINSSIKLPPTVNPKTDISSLKTLRYPQELKQPTGAESKKKHIFKVIILIALIAIFLKWIM